MKTKKILKGILTVLALNVCVASTTLTSNAAQLTGNTKKTFYDYAWSDDSVDYGPVTVYYNGTILGTNYHCYIDNIGTDKVYGTYTPVENYGDCAISSDGLIGLSGIANAGRIAISPSINYTGGKETTVISTRY